MNRSKKVLLIGWDAADWKVINPLMERGEMPNVERLVNGGSMAHLTTIHPPLSPMLWTSIATGKRPFQHGIHGFSEPTADGLGIQPVTNLSRRCKAVWNIFHQNALKSVVIGWWPSHPAEPINGVTVSDHYHRSHGPLEKGWPMLPNTVHPPELADTLAELRLHREEVAGEMAEFFVPRAREIDQKKDRRLSGLASTISECVSIHSAATWLIENQEWDFFAVYYDAIDHFCHGFMKYHPPKQEWINQEDFDLYHGVVDAAYRFHDQMLGTLLSKVGEDVTVILMSDHGFHPDHLRPRAIPHIPAGPAIEHRDFGILAMKGPDIKKDELLHGASVLDITPTLLSLYGLPVGEDMDGKVLVSAFEQAPEVEMIPSWERVIGDDGRHAPHTRLDPVASREALEQLVALGYIEKPDDNREKAIKKTVGELQYNLGEAYQDADRHAEALEIYRALCQDDPDEQRFAVHRFTSCQALGLVDEMRSIVDDLDGRRRALYVRAQGRIMELGALAKERLAERKAQAGASEQAALAPDDRAPEAEQDLVGAIAEEANLLEPPSPEVAARTVGASPALEETKKPEPLLNAEERQELARCQSLAAFQPPVVDYLKAQVLTMEKRYSEALEVLCRVCEADLARPGLFLQTAELFIKLDRWSEAEDVFVKALAIDPDNPHAHLGMCRVSLHRRDYDDAASSALETLERLYHYPLAHFYLGVALRGMRHYRRAVHALRTALSLNPNFAQAHLQLAAILSRRFHDGNGAADHLRLYREIRDAARTDAPRKAAHVDETVDAAVVESEPVDAAVVETEPAIPAEAETLRAETAEPKTVIVSGLPRSGTSMVMQMLSAGGYPILTDGLREADDDNPRGYFEFEPVKQMHRNVAWMKDSIGRAVKVVAPLLRYVPADLTCSVIFIDRPLDEVLHSQGKMKARRGTLATENDAQRDRLKTEYTRLLSEVKGRIRENPRARVLYLDHSNVIRDPMAAAVSIDRFLGGGLNVSPMAEQVNPLLHRNKADKPVCRREPALS
jgi:predicted AlkP superfamily phosphohydrolase/phosphomutase/tetratricopeptide (TPR) repeat protein